MITTADDKLIQQAEKLYHEGLRAQLEQSHADRFVAIEPVSGAYFLGNTMSEAIGAAREAYPDRLVHCVRVGHASAIHFGAWQR